MASESPASPHPNNNSDDQLQRQQHYVLRTIEERGVRLIRLWFTNVLGQHKSVAISPAEMENIFAEGLQFDGSSIDGFSRVQESDVLARPDATSFELLPWARDDEPSALMFCNIENLDGTPFAGDPRQVLRRNLSAARERGFEFFCAPEVEFFYFDESVREGGKPVPLDRASYFDLTTEDVSSNLRKTTLHMLEALSIPVEYSFHEDGPSQHEIDLQYTDALNCADNIMTLRLVVKKVALEQGIHATFMPKPLDGVPGSGMHTHLSLFEHGANAFADAGDPHGLSKTGKSFIAGLLVHGREITAITNQLINSYRRINDGFEAPQYLTWARNNRSALVRVPIHKTGKESATRVEYRAIDPSCNPYLAFSVLLAAGMRGVTEGYELPDEAQGNLFELSADQRRSMGVDSLPRSMAEALDEMEKSDLVRDAVGDHIFEWFLRNRRAEWNEFHRQVTPFELERYLPSW